MNKQSWIFFELRKCIDVSCEFSLRSTQTDINHTIELSHNFNNKTVKSANYTGHGRSKYLELKVSMIW